MLQPGSRLGDSLKGSVRANHNTTTLDVPIIDVICDASYILESFVHKIFTYAVSLNLTFIGPCIANIFAENNQKDATFYNFFISVRRSTCFRRFSRPSSENQNCTYSVRYWSDKYLTLYVQFWAPDDGRKTHLKHVGRLTEIKKLWNFALCWLNSANERCSVVWQYFVPHSKSK